MFSTLRLLSKPLASAGSFCYIFRFCGTVRQYRVRFVFIIITFDWFFRFDRSTDVHSGENSSGYVEHGWSATCRPSSWLFTWHNDWSRHDATAFSKVLIFHIDGVCRYVLRSRLGWVGFFQYLGTVHC